MPGEVPEVSVEAFAQAFQRGEPVVDVRSAEEYAQGHVPGAVNVPLEDVLARPRRFAGSTVHVICRSGGRSLQAAEAMNAAGAQAVSVSGGTSAWIEPAREIERGAWQ